MKKCLQVNQDKEETHKLELKLTIIPQHKIQEIKDGHPEIRDRLLGIKNGLLETNNGFQTTKDKLLSIKDILQTRTPTMFRDIVMETEMTIKNMFLTLKLNLRLLLMQLPRQTTIKMFIVNH